MAQRLRLGMDMAMNLDDNLLTHLVGAPAFTSATAGTIDGPMSTGEALAARGSELAGDLSSSGIVPDEPVLVFVSNAPDDIVGLLAVWQAGGVAVPVHVSTPGRSTDAFKARLGARFAIRGRCVQTIGDTIPPDRPLLRGAALIVFTSGSTGQPKGVVIGHAGLSWKLQVLSKLLRLDKSDTVIVPLQMTFIFGIWVSLLSLMSGAHLVLAPKLLTTGFRKHQQTVSVLATVPSVLRALVGSATLAGPNLRMILTGGEPCGPELASKLVSRTPQAEVLDLFGLTETGSCDFCAVHPSEPDMGGTIGQPTEGVSFRIRPLPELELPGHVGELQVKSPASMLGYLDDPAQTAKAFCDGYIRTGDLVTRLDSGLIQLVGRAKDVVSRGGNKIAPLEIENLFNEHERVAAALAFGVPDDQLGERLHLMLVIEGGDLSTDELRAWSADKLERFKTPDVFHIVPDLPKGRTGKADRVAARAVVTQMKDVQRVP